MSRGFVADASVGVSWAALSQSSEAGEHLLAEVASGAPLVVPVLWMFEVANALLILLRRRRIDSDQFTRGRDALSHLMPVLDEEDPRLALKDISDLAERYSLTIYDATYLELAIRRRLSLASFDSALNRAARLCSVKTLL